MKTQKDGNNLLHEILEKSKNQVDIEGLVINMRLKYLTSAT